MHINQESRASGLCTSLLGEQRLPLGTRKLHWLLFWTLRAPLTDNAASFAKTWSRANAHKVDHLHAKQQHSSCIHEPLLHRGDGGSQLPAGRCAIAFALVPVGG
ncbi:hypothetical protein Trydic_g22630 [Trypoxylus dichotomus]